MSQQDSHIARSVSESAGAERSRVSVIEKSVTHLLVATKSLLETLTKWSKNNATESEVSDVYVRLGYEFNIACRAFKSVGIDTSDLGPVPDLLRAILEETLSGEPSQVHLDRYLPQIRDIIVNLLQGLKRKQQKLRQKHPRERDSSIPTASASTDVRQSSAASISQPIEPPQQFEPPKRQDTYDRLMQDVGGNMSRSVSARDSVQSRRPDIDRTTPATDTPTFSPATQTPVITHEPSYFPENFITVPEVQVQEPKAEETLARQTRSADALAALQRGGELERRASRRFSAYQISRHLGSPGVPLIPPTQNSPIPNRGRDVQESMNAVRNRGAQAAASKYNNNSPSRRPVPERKEAVELAGSVPPVELPAETLSVRNIDKPLPSEKTGQTRTEQLKGASEKASSETIVRHPSRKQSSLTQTTDSTDEPSTKALTLFLQFKSRIKKFVLADGYEELSIPRLQLAFIEKFAWNTHNNGTDLPEIYLQDPLSGVRYELEDLKDIKNRSVLILNVDALDEVKKHVDDNVSGLRGLVQDMRTAVSDQTSMLRQVVAKQQDTAKEVARLADQPMPAATVSTTSSHLDVGQLAEVQSLRRDLAVMRQSYTSWIAEMKSSMATIHAKADAVKTLASQQPSIPTDTNDSTAGRAYVTAGRKTLNTTSESIMTRVEDLQDTVEDLRKDVVTRGVRPLPRQLDAVSKEIAATTSELKKLQEYIRREKPTWTKIWKNELQVVCEDQNLLTYQEELTADLEADLAAANETFALVEEATKQQNLNNPPSSTGTITPTGSRNPSRTLNPAADPVKAKDSVLDEVKALQPNHESRLEAIERAERARQRELSDRRDGEHFKKELSGFVDEGRLRKSGGVEEAERVRKVKDERARRQNWERMNGAVAEPVPLPLPQTQESTSTASPTSPSEPLGVDLSSLGGFAMPDRVDAVIAEAAPVPKPLEVDHHEYNMHSQGYTNGSSPDPVFVEASEEIYPSARG